jgi:glucose/mannose transport system substrate-binding protein
MKARILGLLLSFGVTAPLLAAPRAEPAGGGAAGRSLIFYHWWRTPAEMAAIGALSDVFKKRHPGAGAITHNADSPGGGGKMFLVVRSASASGKPPDVFQVHAGSPMRPYLDAGLVAPLDKAWTEEGLEKVVPPIIQTMSRVEGRYYVLPINVHRTNVLWYNKRLLDKHGIDAAALGTWKGLFEAAEKLRSAGVRHPVHLGPDWAISLALESIMASLGVQTFEDWINGKITSPEHPQLLEAVGLLRTYLSYGSAGPGAAAALTGLEGFIEGESAFCIMGDWANGDLSIAGLKYGKDYAAMPAPGTKGLYAVTIDGFAQPRGLPDPSTSDRWMMVAASREGQDAFNVAKGSISARTDCDTGRYDAYQKSAIADFKSAKTIYPALSNSTHDAFKAAIDDAMKQFRVDLDVKKAATATAMAARRGAKKFTQVWTLK